MRPIDADELEELWTGISPGATVHPDSVIDTIKRAKTIKDVNQVHAHWIPWKDKMLYISHLPLIFKNTIDLSVDAIAEKEVRDSIHSQLDYKLDEEDDVLDRDDIYSFEFMCQCFVDGMRYVRPLQEYESYSSSTNDETQKVMFRIMQIVMSWEPEEENH